MNSAYVMLAIQAMLVAVGGELEGASIGLFTNVGPLSDDIELDDIVEPTFTGYAPILVGAWIEASTMQGEDYLTATPKQWQATDAVGLPQLVTGAYLFKGANLLRASLAPAPIIMAAEDQTVHATPVFGLSSAAWPAQELSTV